MILINKNFISTNPICRILLVKFKNKTKSARYGGKERWSKKNMGKL